MAGVAGTLQRWRALASTGASFVSLEAHHQHSVGVGFGGTANICGIRLLMAPAPLIMTHRIVCVRRMWSLLTLLDCVTEWLAVGTVLHTPKCERHRGCARSIQPRSAPRLPGLGAVGTIFACLSPTKVVHSYISPEPLSTPTQCATKFQEKNSGPG